MSLPPPPPGAPPRAGLSSSATGIPPRVASEFYGKARAFVSRLRERIASGTSTSPRLATVRKFAAECHHHGAVRRYYFLLYFNMLERVWRSCFGGARKAWLLGANCQG